jgi:hypothetical protein
MRGIWKTLALWIFLMFSVFLFLVWGCLGCGEGVLFYLPEAVAYDGDVEGRLRGHCGDWG